MTKVAGVSVGGDATVWCLDRGGRLHKWEGGRWRTNPTAVALEVAVGNSANVWCRNSNGELFKAASSDYATSWQKLADYPGAGLVSLSVNLDRELWIVNGQSEVWRYLNGLWTMPGNARDGRLVSTGSSTRTCYVNHAGLLKVSGIDVGGLTWAAIRKPSAGVNEVSLKSVSYGVEGVIWASDTNDQMYKRGRTDRIWRHNPNGAAVQVAVGPTTEVWCVNKEGQIFRASHALGNVNTYWQPIPEPGFVTYTVRQGDTLFSLVPHLCPGISDANRNAMMDEIVRLNNLTRYTDAQGHDVIRIEAGQTLNIPPCP
jgi:hypothetical protein